MKLSLTIKANERGKPRLGRFFAVLLISLSWSTHSGLAQKQALVNLEMKDTDLKQVIWEIEKQSGITFIYNSSDIEEVKINDLSIKGKTVEQALAQSVIGTGFTYESKDGVYVLQKLPRPAPSPPTGTLQVTGKVTDGQSSLPGVTIILSGTTTGTVTNIDGLYSITVPRTDTSALTYTFIGMKPVTIRVAGRSRIDVVMEEEAVEIEQLVFTGYGNKEADAYTGAAHVISSQQIGVRAIGTIEEALRGLSPGTIVAGGGQPGQELEVRLRGIGSLNTNNQPLYVVDGVVWDQVNMSGNANTSTNPLNALNPADIANITELKDAASASLYGSRGANGVIVITTKQGMETDKTRFSLNVQSGVSLMTGQPELTSGREYAELWSEGQMHYLIQQQLARDGRSGRAELISELKQLYSDKDGYRYGNYNYNQWMKLANADFNALYQMPASNGTYRNYDYFGTDRGKLPSTDWFDQISRAAPFYRVNLSMQGGSRTMKYYNSMEYFDQQGTIIQSYLKRYALRMKLSSESDRQFVNWGLNTYLAYTEQSGPLSGGQAYNSPHYAAVLLPSVISPYLEDGSYNFQFPNNLLNSNHNPLASAKENINEKPLTNINTAGWIQLRFTSWLRLKTTASLYYLGIRRHAYYDNRFGTGLSTNGQLYERDVHRRKITNSNLLYVNKTWRGRHRLNVVAGTELEDLRYRANEINVSNFITNDKPSASMGSEMSRWDGGGYDHALFSILSSVDYSYRYRYFVSASYRSDKSSMFSPDNRMGHFWSVSGAYKISNEPFFKPLLKVINNLRIKGSFGINGNLPNSYYLWRDAYESSNYMGEPGASQLYRPSADLTWEGNRIWNVGLDLRMLGNRLQFEVQYYHRRSKDLIQDVPVSMGSGYEIFTMNTSAGINNRGVEIDISGNPLSKGKWNIDLSFNLATLKSTYYGLGFQKLDSYSRQIMMDGVSVYSWYLREFGGIDPETGSVLYVSYDDDGNRYLSTSTAQAPFRIVGQGLPKITGGFRASVSYGCWELSALCSYGLGHHIYDRLGGSIISTNGSNDNAIATTQLNRWTPDNTDAKWPLRVNNSGAASRHTGYLVKGDYLKIKNIKLQFSVPEPTLKKLKITGATIYVQAENPFIFSHLKDYDPEMSLTGYRYTDRYPTAATFTAGLTLAF